jgi:hypothetical protein
VEKLSTVPVTYLAAYCLNLYQADELLTKMEKKAWKDLNWSLDEGNEWMGGEWMKTKIWIRKMKRWSRIETKVQGRI